MKSATATIAVAMSLLAKWSLASEEHAAPAIIAIQVPGLITVPGSPPKATTIHLTSECSPKFTVLTSTVPGPHPVTSYYIAWTEAGQVSSATLTEYPIFSQAQSCAAAPTAGTVPPYSPVQGASTTIGFVPTYTPILSSVGPYSGSAHTVHPGTTDSVYSIPSIYTSLVAQESLETATGTDGPYTGPVITPVIYSEPASTYSAPKVYTTIVPKQPTETATGTEGPYTGPIITPVIYSEPASTRSVPSVYTTLVPKQPTETATGTASRYTGPIITPVIYTETGFVTSIRN